MEILGEVNKFKTIEKPSSIIALDRKSSRSLSVKSFKHFKGDVANVNVLRFKLTERI